MQLVVDTVLRTQDKNIIVQQMNKIEILVQRCSEWEKIEKLKLG